MYRHWCAGEEGAVPPRRVNVEAVARTRWVCAQVEYVQEGEYEEKGILYAHLPGEVLAIDFREEFPWRLLSLNGWGERQEMLERLRLEA